MRLPRSPVPGQRLVLPTLGVQRARTAVAASFSVSGIALASFISRAPGIRDALGLSSAQLGLLLLCSSGGSIMGLPLSGRIVHRLGPAHAVLAASLTVTTGLILLGTGLHVGIVGVAAVGFVLIGLGIGIWDVAMNVAGADVERQLGRSLMPRLHAAFSLGTVAGAGVGAASAAAGVPLAGQVFAVAALVPVSMAVAVRFFLPARNNADVADGCGVLAAWREPRTLLIGLLVLGFAFIEGSANDWIAVAMVDGYGTSEAVGAIGFGLFVSAMTAGRLIGNSALDRFGRVAVLRVTALTTAAGVLLVVLGGNTTLALAGAALWSLGASLGFPVGISAAADDPARAAARVSVVSSIGYAAFLAGPPLIGLVTENAGIRRALLIVLGALALGLLTSGASRHVAPIQRRTVSVRHSLDDVRANRKRHYPHQPKNGACEGR
ncbi:MAG TPA: MFS transporter [Pseudonocardiaceae bacterium]|nr:MFS transporter [Pseudonocardiaceae bacterium]